MQQRKFTEPCHLISKQLPMLGEAQETKTKQTIHPSLPTTIIITRNLLRLDKVEKIKGRKRNKKRE